MSIKIIEAIIGEDDNRMNKDINFFIDLMDKEQDVYTGLLGLGIEKKALLKEKDINLLADITRKEEDLLSCSQKLEVKRREFFKDKDKPSEWIKTLPEKERKKVQSKRKSLIKTINDLNRINTINEKLIMKSMELIEYTLKMMTSIQNKTAVYNSAGKSYTRTKNVESTIFDRKS